MQINRPTYMTPLALAGLIVIVLVACTNETPTTVPTSETNTAAEVATEAPTPAATPKAPVDSPSEPGSPTSAPTPTPTSDPEETPVSETESVGFYIRGFNSIGRGEYIEAERTFNTVIQLEPGFARGWDGRGQALMLQGSSISTVRSS